MRDSEPSPRVQARDAASAMWPTHACHGEGGVPASNSPRKCCGSGCPGGVKQRREHVAREWGEGLMGVELVADKCSVNVLLKESGEVKAGKGFRETPATCSCGAGRQEGRGPSIHVGSEEKSGRRRRRPAGGCGGRAGRGADPGR